eukprot:2083983-Amphidinium_carterae.1
MRLFQGQLWGKLANNHVTSIRNDTKWPTAITMRKLSLALYGNDFLNLNSMQGWRDLGRDCTIHTQRLQY